MYENEGYNAVIARLERKEKMRCSQTVASMQQTLATCHRRPFETHRETGQPRTQKYLVRVPSNARAQVNQAGARPLPALEKATCLESQTRTPLVLAIKASVSSSLVAGSA